MNIVGIIGRLADTPELHTTPSGYSVTSFTVATRRPGTFGDTVKTDWIECVAWRNEAEFICKYFEKGMGISIRGQIETRDVEKDGQKRKKIEVNVKEVEFVPKTKVKEGIHTEEFAVNEFMPNEGIHAEEPAVNEFMPADIPGEDLPF